MADNIPLYFIIAGEASGDLLGVRLMRALKAKHNGSIRFMGIGGARMVAEGMDLLFPQAELAHFGLFELLRHVPRLFKRMDETAAAIRAAKPKALITIDAPDFCFRVAKKIKSIGVPHIHYVAPTVWAWRPKRAKKIAQFLTHLLALLPFEPPYFTREGLGCTFVGHSIVESGADRGDAARFREKFTVGDSVPVVTVLPGSRISEVSRLMPIFGETLRQVKQKYPDLRVVLPTVPHLADYVRAQSAGWTVPVILVDNDADKYDGFVASRAALACSGTVALELALARLPAVIAYKISWMTYYLYRRLIKVRFANLVNIMHDRMVVPELLQKDCTPEKLAETLCGLIGNDTQRQTQINGLAEVGTWLGQGQFVPSERAAETIIDVVRKAHESTAP